MIRLAVGIMCGLAFGAFLAAALSLVGCDSLDDKAWQIERTRVLGARVESNEDTTRAWLAPGENGTMTWLVESPVGVREVSWAMATCVADDVRLGDPACKGPTLTSTSGRVTDEQISMPIAMPTDDVLGNATTLLVMAIFCTSGEPALDAPKFDGRCVNGAEPSTLTSFELTVMRDGATNHNPSIDDDAFHLVNPKATSPEDLMLPPASGKVTTETCEAGPDLPLVVAGSDKRTFHVRMRADAREMRPAPDDALEQLELSHFSTAGEMQRQFTLLQPDSQDLDMTVEWTPPPVDQVGDQGKLVRFVYALRDLRGGIAYATRAVCVRRP